MQPVVTSQMEHRPLLARHYSGQPVSLVSLTVTVIDRNGAAGGDQSNGTQATAG